MLLTWATGIMFFLSSKKLLVVLCLLDWKNTDCPRANTGWMSLTYNSIFWPIEPPCGSKWYNRKEQANVWMIRKTKQQLNCLWKIFTAIITQIQLFLDLGIMSVMLYSSLKSPKLPAIRENPEIKSTSQFQRKTSCFTTRKKLRRGQAPMLTFTTHKACN